MRSPGLYLHVPFCASKCRYCDFYSETRLERAGDWLDAVSVEARLHAGLHDSFGTLYVGGGTPSLLSAVDLERLAAALFDSFRFDDGFEFTIEANPDDLDRDKFDLYRSLGVNRISIGVQSFDGDALRLLGRRHDPAGAADAVEGAREAGFDNVSLDLIYAIPGQTKSSWLDTLERALRFDPEHISCYELTLEEHTPISRMIRDGEVTGAADETKRDLFLVTHEELERRGYVHYEVSSYARCPELVSRHNTRYWDHTPYIGLGPSAHSFSSGGRWWNVDDIDRYCEMLKEGEAPVGGKEELLEGQLLLERLYFGFRTADGLPLEFFDSLPGGRETLAELERTGLVRMKENGIVPTPLGFLFSDGLPPLFSAG